MGVPYELKKDTLVFGMPGDKMTFVRIGRIPNIWKDPVLEPEDMVGKWGGNSSGTNYNRSFEIILNEDMTYSKTIKTTMYHGGGTSTGTSEGTWSYDDNTLSMRSSNGDSKNYRVYSPNEFDLKGTDYVYRRRN